MVTDVTSYPRITALKTFESTVFVSRDSSVGRATRYELDGPGRGEIFHTRPDRPWGPLSLLYIGYWVSFPGVKRPGRGVNHPPLSNAEVKERVELYLCSPLGLYGFLFAFREAFIAVFTKSLFESALSQFSPPFCATSL